MFLALITATLLAATCVHIFYLIRLSRAFGKTPNAQNPSVHVSVSVVISARNEYNNLKELLPLLATQNHPDFEVVVVNDRSDDASEDFLREFATRDDRFRYIHVASIPDHVNPKKYALTLGIKACRHDVILLTDADCRPATDRWIAAMTEHMNADTSFVLGYSPYVLEPGLLNRFIQFETLLTAFHYLGWALLRKPYMGVGRNLCYRKSIFLTNKGFNQHVQVTGGDDDLLVNRLAHADNTRVSLHPDSFVYSVPLKKWRSHFLQKVRHLSVGKYYKTGDKARLALFTFSHYLVWCSGVVLMFFPETLWIGLGAWIVNTLCFVLCLGRVSRVLQSKLNPVLLIFLDFIFLFYYLSTGLTTLAIKRIPWRN